MRQLRGCLHWDKPDKGEKMLKVAVIGVIAVFLAMPLQRDKAEFGMLVVFAACLIIMGMALTKLSSVLQVVKSVEDYLGKDVLYLNLLLKMLGITYIAEFGAGICRDAGYGAAGRQIEVFGKLLILAVSLPIIQTLLQTISSFF